MISALALALALGFSPVHAQLVTIGVTDASLADVVESLEDMTGVKIAGATHVSADTHPITIDARDMPLKRVMRDICAQAGVYIGRNQMDYFLQGGSVVDRRPCVEVHGYQVYLESIDVSRSASISLRRREESAGGWESLRVHVAVEAYDDEMLSPVVSTTSNLVVELDTGDVLTQPARHKPEGPSRGMSSALRQSALGASADFPFPPPGAKRIVAVEGELCVHTDLTTFDFEFDVGETGVTKRHGDISLTLTSIDLEDREALFQLSVPDAPGDEDDKWVRLAAVTAFDRQGMASMSKDSWWPQRMGAESDTRTFTQTIYFDWDRGYKPAILRYRGIIAGNAVRRLPYRFEDLPLPMLRPVD